MHSSLFFSWSPLSGNAIKLQSQVISLVNSYQICAFIVSSRKVFTENTLYFDMSVHELHSRTLTALSVNTNWRKKKNGVPCKHINSCIPLPCEAVSSEEECELLHDVEVKRSPKKTENKSSAPIKHLRQSRSRQSLSRYQAAKRASEFRLSVEKRNAVIILSVFLDYLPTSTPPPTSPLKPTSVLLIFSALAMLPIT